MRLLERVILLLLLALGCFADQGDGGENEGYYNSFSVCSGSIVQAQDISILCSSPGAYYYGSSNYRDQADCQAGDKAKVQISIAITANLTQSALLDLKVEGPSGVYTTVFSGASLCSSISATDGASCPAQGSYKISKTVYLGEKDNSGQLFTANAVMGAYSDASLGIYDLGGLNTDKCASGHSVVSWTSGVQNAGRSLRSFMLTFGALLVAVFGIAGVGFYIAKKAKEVKVDKKKKQPLTEDIDPNEDYQKISMLGNNRNLVDF
jgi:hypothetical protein